MKQSTFSAQVANNLLTVLQGYSKTIRLLLVMFLTLTVNVNAWADYTITFNTGTGSEVTTKDAIIYAGGDYVSSVSASKTYAESDGLRYGSSSAMGYTTFTLSNTGRIQASKIIFQEVKYYSSDESSLSYTITYTDATTTSGTIALTSTATDKEATLESSKTISQIDIRKTVNSKRRFYVKGVTVVAASAAPSYTITATSNNINFGTVSVSGTTITATPKTGYRVSTSSPFSISPAGSATVTQNGNTFAVTPTANCTITINFEAIPKYTVTWNVNGEVYETTQVSEGSKPTFPATPSSCDATSNTFYGWATATWDGKIDNISEKTIYTSANEMPEVNGAVTYYAVFAENSGGASFDGTTGGNFKIYAIVNGTKYYAKGTGSKISSTTEESDATEYTFTKTNTSFTIKTGTSYITYSSSTNLGTSATAYNWDISGGTNGSWRITSTANTSRGIIFRASTFNQFGGYSVGNASAGSTEYFDVEIGSSPSYSNYITSCTTEPSYSVTSTLSHVTGDAENATTINPEDEELLLSYSAESGWNLPATISVTMGGAPLSSETDYDWDNGDLLIAPASGFTGNIVVTINGWKQLAAPENPKTTNITATSATLSWNEVANASSYLVTIVDGGDLSADIPNTQTSHTFEGLTPSTEYLWTVKAIGDGITYTNSEESETAEFTTSAVAPNTYTITFEANGGTRIDKITDATALPDPLPTTTRDHYTFAGWFTDEDCTQAATAGATINANTTLYAKWTPVTYTVTFDAGSGTYTSGDIQGNFETGLELPTATPCTYAQENGWSFVGWSESSVSETTVRPAIHTDNYKPTKTITLHAVYAKTGTAQGGAGEFVLSLQYEGTTYYVGQTFDNSKLSAETNQANAALFTIEDNYLHYEGGYISHVAEGTANMTKQADKANAKAWTITEEANTIIFTSTADNTRGLGFNYNNGSPRFAAYKLNEKDGETIKYPSTFTKTSVSGGNVQVTTYNSNPSCEAPVDPTWVDAQITHTAIKANCGSTTVLGAEDENGPATITFNGSNLVNPVTITASEGFLVSINKTNDAAYSNTVTVNPVASGDNQGKITQNVYVIAQAPAQSGNYDGTITLTGADITNGSQVINVTAAVTCTQYTITWSVNGDDSHQVTYSPGDALLLPEIDVTPCDGMDHVGWTDNMGYDHGTDILFTETTDMTVTSDKTYYAVFAASTSSGGGETTTTLDFTTQGYANQTTVTSLTINAVTVTFDKGTNSNAPKYYTTGTAVRVYGGGYFTVSSTNTISEIVITFSSGEDSNEITTDVGTYDTNTWTGSANNITFTIGGSSGHRRIKSIAVTSAGGGASYYTGHTTTCSGSQQLATPTNLQAIDITYNGATLTWGAVAGANKYEVVINGTKYISNTNSYTTYALKPQTAYTWTVQAIGNGTTFTDSEISAEATFTTGTALTITWSVSTNTTTTTITKGQPIGANLKTPATPAGCEGKVFMGWSASSTVNSDGSDFTPITSDIVPETNVTYYAVFAEPTGNGGAQGELFSESFNTMNGKGGNDETWNNISSSTEAQIDGWSFTKGYVASQCIRLGTGSVAGQATTPALDINGNATLTFNAGAWNGNSENLTINLQIVGEGSITPSSVTLTKGQFNPYTANITDANADTKVKFSAATASNNRFFLDEVKVSGGTGNTNYTGYSTSCGTYTVIFYGFNNGEYTTICNDNPAEIAVAQGKTYQIPNCEPTVDPAGLGRTFAGTWNTQANGKGTAYEPGDEFIVDSDITLYAQWALNTSGNTTLPTDVEDLATTDVVVTGGTTLTLQAGTTTINSLTLKGGLQENGTYAMPVVNIPTGATLVRNNNKINLDLKVNNNSYYPFAVPFEVANTSANVNYINTTLKEYANANNGYGKYYRILEYNGALRAENGVNSEENWVHVGRTDVKLMPGKGYAISAVPAAGDDTVTIRITMNVDNAWLADGEQESITVKEQTTTRNAISVTAHTGIAANKDICNAGWNFVANPYLTNFTTNNHITGVDYIGGEIIVSNGQFVKDGTDVPYVTIPNANMSWYEQCRVEDAILSPMYSFFVQIAEGGTMTFTTDGRQQAPAALRASSEQANPSFEADIVILNNQEQIADHTGLVINDRWTPAYEIGGDLEKMFGTANRTAIYTLSGNTRLAYNALSYNDALVAIPIGFCAQADGEYTIQLSNTEDIVGVECIELKDLYNNQTTNLLYTDYTFYSDATQEDSRFVVYIVPQKNTPTDISTIINGNTENRKIIFNNHLYIIHNGNIYNGAGQMVK